ncbi:hypothetical protein CIB84_003238 [Bambusicola thoracicus]|uniref:C3H1-type domain-containing protein n=1 Tax=Bambusicola thoracicus TaxID=9083 RepID=A0A2P4T9I2_BAMTH|nr:hypothetical protein CIB84_003238 [Bambusicola thoracicus]
MRGKKGALPALGKPRPYTHIRGVECRGEHRCTSTLPYPGTQEQYELFIRELVRNLFNEGNDVYREGDWRGSLNHYSEAINIADYANSEEIHVSDDILEKLHVNRIACFSNMGLHEKVLEDCEIALRLNENNFRALYRKAKALNELGRYKTAYDAVAKCSLAVPQDESVIKLTQELAQKLGLKIRKAYVRAKNSSSVEDIELDLSGQKQDTISSASSSAFVSELSKVASVPISSLSSVMSLQAEKASLPSAALANGGNVSFSMSEACLDCGDGDIIIGEELDELLDSVPDPDESVMQTTGARGPIPAGGVAPSVPFSASLLGTLPVSTGFVPPPSLSEIFSQPLASSLENFCSPLSTFSISDPKRDVAAEEECRYPGHCTFAYCQEEIDVWTLERKGAFSREALFGGNGKISFTVSRLLQEHHGFFMFLCEKCFDHKPRIISKRNKDNSSSCSHPAMHDFEDNKCLVHILRETMVKYSKVRPFQVRCQLDLCRHEVHYGCLREDKCFYAHSLVELKVWIMQKETGISHDAIVQESKKYWQNMEASAHGSQILGNQMKYGSLNLKMKFVCGQCWRNGQVNEPDRNKKYCSAKARHPPEEREMWTYMKENSIQDLEQLYDIWLKSQKPEKGDDTAAQANKENGKQIHMPTDYAEVTVDFHCWMCGKNCNSEKQWQGHISSEKHKEKVFHTEDDQNCWQYRFPTGCFSICDRPYSGFTFVLIQFFV